MYVHYSAANYDIALNISHVQCDRFLIHSHPYYELHYFVRGDVEMIYDGQIIRLRPHGMTLISPDVPHGVRVLSTEDYERFTVHFTEDVVPPELRGELLAVFDARSGAGVRHHMRSLSTSNIVRFIKELVQMHTLTEAQRELLVPPMITSLLICVMMNQEVEVAADEKEHELSSQAVAEYIHAHLTEPLTLTDLAQTFYCSKGYLNKLFKRETGFTVMSFVQRCRLNYARMLIENGYPAAKACSIAGFNEYSSFFRAYVKHFGTSPSSDAQTPALSVDSIALAELTPDMKAPSGRKNIWDMYSQDRPEDDPAILNDQ